LPIVGLLTKNIALLTLIVSPDNVYKFYILTNLYKNVHFLIIFTGNKPSHNTSSKRNLKLGLTSFKTQWRWHDLVGSMLASSSKGPRFKSWRLHKKVIVKFGLLAW
jgi:hypothetical protein